MTKSKKGARNIVVADVKYRWRAKGNGGWIDLTIWPDNRHGAAIASSFDYDHTLVPIREGVWAGTRQVVITNRIVRRVIEHAVGEHGYDPHAEAPQLGLGRMDDVIEMGDALRSE